MSEFSHTSSFRLTLVGSDGERDRVLVSIGLSGLKILDAASNRAMRSYELDHIARWQLRDGSLLLYTKTPSDVEERQVQLQGDDNTLRTALDTLASSCMQLAELLSSKQSQGSREAAEGLNALVAGNGKKKSKLPTSDEVQYWNNPDKAGWLMSQSEHLKAWRKRWFVLKQGFLFRFMTASVTEATKPRGIVDLSKIQDVKPASDVTGKPNSLQLKTATGGSVCYIADSETDLVEWVSVIEGSVQKICRHAAGLGDEDAPFKQLPPSSNRNAASGSSDPNRWMKQLERNLEGYVPAGRVGGGGGGGGGGRGQSSSDSYYDSGSDRGQGGPAMVTIVGYEPSAGGGGGGGGGGGYMTSSSAPPYSSSGYQANAGGGYALEAIAGAQNASHGMDSYSLNYGGGPSGPSSAAPHYDPSLDPYLSRGTPSYQQQLLGANPYPCQPQCQPQYQQQQQAPSFSLLDQMPHQQPTYPHLMQSAPPPPTQQQQQDGNAWQVHYTSEGRPYYHNAVTGSTQWDAPVGFAQDLTR